MKRCYIAGKIGDLPKEEYEANFAKAEQRVRELGYEPVSPLKLPHNHGRTWREYMIEDLKALLDCDAVFAQHNVRFSPGAMIEINTANAIGITVIHQTQ
jgi:hypothetical protein